MMLCVKIGEIEGQILIREISSAHELVARIAAQLGLAHVRREREAPFRLLAMASSEMLYKMSPHWSEMRYLKG
jgi:hypothetical protein